jgi:WXG100 family type VII secretion target
MTSPLQVDPALMAKGKSLVADASVEINGILATLQGDVDELLVGWQSTGASSFTSAHAAWTSKARQISTALDDLGQKLGIVGVTTDTGDQNVASSFTQFSS